MCAVFDAHASLRLCTCLQPAAACWPAAARCRTAMLPSPLLGHNSQPLLLLRTHRTSSGLQLCQDVMSTPPIALKATGKVADAATCMTEVRYAFQAV